MRAHILFRSMMARPKPRALWSWSEMVRVFHLSHRSPYNSCWDTALETFIKTSVSLIAPTKRAAQRAFHLCLFFTHSVFKAALKEAEFQRKEHIRKQGMNIFDDIKKNFGTSSKQV